MSTRRQRSSAPRPWLLPALAALPLLPGCAGQGGGLVPLTVRVSDAATREPVAGAHVGALTPNRNHPFSVATMLGRTDSIQDRATTDATGEATVRVTRERPFKITVLAPGYRPATYLEQGLVPELDVSRPLEIELER